MAHLHNYLSYNIYRVWSRTNNQGYVWRKGQVEIKFTGIINIDVEGVAGNGHYGDIAVDDFVVTKGHCPEHGGFCDFEDGMCEFTPYKSKPSDFHWTRGNGGSPSTGDGPLVDHTTRSKLGSYIFVFSFVLVRRVNQCHAEEIG